MIQEIRSLRNNVVSREASISILIWDQLLVISIFSAFKSTSLQIISFRHLMFSNMISKQENLSFLLINERL